MSAWTKEMLDYLNADKVEESPTLDFERAAALAETNAPQLYAVPVQRRKVRVASATPPGRPNQADPLLVEGVYDNILQTIGCMARVMELTAEAFAEMDATVEMKWIQN